MEGKVLMVSTRERFRSVMVSVFSLLISGVLVVLPVSAKTTEEPDSAGGPAVMRRLTESQYRATIGQIFGKDIPIVGRFEPGLRSEGLIAVGTSEAGISPFSIEQYDASARGIAAAVVSEEHRGELVPCEPKSDKNFDATCARKFVDKFGRLLFRRPMTQKETDRFVAAAQSGYEQLGNFYNGLEFALTGMLVSPEFLLRIERVEPEPGNPGHLRLDAYSRATRLSYFLTNSTPDYELLRAAADGDLDTREGLKRQVDRLMASPGYEMAVRAFFEDLLEFDLFDDLSKDPVIYPSYNSVVAEDAREQTLRTIVDLLLVKEGDYRELFTTRNAPMTRSLGIIYKMPVAARNGWEMKEFSVNSKRAGIQSHISFLALHSHPGRSSPTLRGKAIREVFMCQKVPDPPANVNFMNFSDDSDSAKLTARDRLVAHRTQPVCAGCHSLMDPLGLTLENFDGAGSFRSKENGVLIDLSGGLDGQEFVAAPGLGEALRNHPETPRCLVSKMYRSGVGRKVSPAEWAYIEYLNTNFATSGYQVPELIRTIALSDTFYAVSDTGQSADKVASTEQDSGGPL